jgi:hypothetical protein
LIARFAANPDRRRILFELPRSQMLDPASPILRVISGQLGLLNTRKRRGVTPLVTFVNPPELSEIAQHRLFNNWLCSPARR